MQNAQQQIIFFKEYLTVFNVSFRLSHFQIGILIHF